MIFISEKESFIARVLIKKAEDARVFCEYVKCSVDAINSHIEDAELLALYMEDGERPSEEILHFISDIISEKGLQIILIGEQRDLDFVLKHFSESDIYMVFPRPVDNSLFAASISDYFKKISSGEFKKSILVVDDDPQYLAIVREWLKGSYKVSMVTSGMQAIKWLAKNKVDLILLDYEMPVTTGPQVLEMLRSEPETCSIPVMFLTGKSDKESVMQVMSLKPEGYFLKSIQKEELLEKLNEFFILHK